MHNVNQRLYKFKAFDRGQDSGEPYSRDREIIVGGQIWASAPSSFNDPFDCYPVPNVETTDEQLLGFARHKAIQAGLPEDHYLQGLRRLKDKSELLLNEEIRREMLSGVGVFCLTECCRNIIMWSYYADNHLGYCLEIDRNFDPFNQAEKVKYDDERPVFDVFDLNKADALSNALCLKASCQKNEREWRLFKPDGHGIYKYDPSALKSIILGAMISSEDEEIVRGMNELRVQPVDIKRAELCGRTYKILVDGQ